MYILFKPRRAIMPSALDDSYAEGPVVVLTAWAYFLWTAWGLTPAQAAIAAQVCPASRRRRTW